MSFFTTIIYRLFLQCMYVISHTYYLLHTCCCCCYALSDLCSRSFVRLRNELNIIRDAYLHVWILMTWLDLVKRYNYLQCCIQSLISLCASLKHIPKPSCEVDLWTAEIFCTPTNCDFCHGYVPAIERLTSFICFFNFPFFSVSFWTYVIIVMLFVFVLYCS